MTDQTHPSYPSPTIQEALCEMRFPADPSLFPSQAAQVLERLRGEFLLHQTFVDVLPPPAPNMLVSGPVPTQPRFVLQHARRAFLLQFMPGAFTLNTVSPYLGWETMRDDVERVWREVQETLAVSQVTHFAVRYINRVPLSLPLTDAGGWIEAGDYVPAAVVRATPPFQSRVQTGTGTGDVTTLSIGHVNLGTEIDPARPDPAMIVDLERNRSGLFAATPSDVMGQVEVLHSDVWDLFKAVKGPRWNDVLQGKF